MGELKVQLVDLRAQYRAHKKAFDGAIRGVMEAGAFIGGGGLNRFEQAFAEFCGVKFGVGVGNGTDAISIALGALGIGKGDRVLMPAFTFIATAHAVVDAGAIPVLVDSDPMHYTMDPARCAATIARHGRGKIKALVPVHLYGQAADMDPLLAPARQHRMKVVEDCAQAHGARYRGRKIGSMGHAGAFSFYPSKNLGAAGDGGMIVTRDARTAERAERLHNHGRSSRTKSKYIHYSWGRNSRLDGLQAALLFEKLRHLDRWTEQRRRLADRYADLLGGDPNVRLPQIAPYSYHVFHAFVVLVRNRDRVAEEMRRRGIGVEIHYPVPVHLQPSMKGLGYKRGDFPVSELLARSCLTLPLYPEMTPSQQRLVVRELKRAISK